MQQGEVERGASHEDKVDNASERDDGGRLLGRRGWSAGDGEGGAAREVD